VTLVHPGKFSMSAPAHEKSSALATLAGAHSDSPRKFQARLGAVGARASRHVPSLRAALASKGPGAVVGALRRIFAEKDTAQVFGAFSLKLMPHLLPPTEGDAAFWSGLLDEFAPLANLAADLPPTAAVPPEPVSRIT
jgi:hypothetical protein